MLCERCGSEDVHKLSDVRESELSSCAPIATRAQPPQQLNVFVQLVIAVGCVLAGIAGSKIWWLIAASFAILVVAGISWNRTTWPKRYAEWERRLVCGRCGWVGTPSTADAAPGQRPLEAPANQP